MTLKTKEMKKKEKWEKEFDHLFKDRFKGHISWVEGLDLPNDIKSFIRQTIVEELEKERERVKGVWWTI